MLKRLELLGFKSFADKTTFQFGSGITCVVGPNGSGKSNVVDAIKWVLGEQSPKSLRGKEMADVIFNGSATRRALGFAEASLVFDNRDRRLPVDADEVQLTRRVYRSGDGEYLINKNASRLRDFRDLLLGTGAGTEAYAVIEQGKVDVLLQASTKERRTLFEEAAGISRFKARKLEAMRKLEHVEGNLLRVADIVEEVEKQLRSVKLQAAKARRYQEHSEALRELRLKVGAADFHALTEQLTVVEQKIAALTQDMVTQSSRCDSADAKLIQIQSLTEELDNQTRTLEAGMTETRQEIAGLDREIAYERATARDLAAQIERLRGQWSEFSRRVAELQKHIAGIEQEVHRVERHYDASRSEVEAEEAAIEQLRSEAESQAGAVEGAKNQFMESLRAKHQIHNELSGLDAQEKTLTLGRQRLAGRCAEMSGSLEQVSAEIRVLAEREGSVEQDRDTAREELARISQGIDQLEDTREEIATRLSTQREQRSAVAARIELLEDLQQRQEGLGSGVQQALALPQLTANVVGLVADLLQVEVEHAEIIERALGDRAQHIVVRRQYELVQLLGDLGTRFEGPASFISLDCLTGAGQDLQRSRLCFSISPGQQRSFGDTDDMLKHNLPISDGQAVPRSVPGFIASADSLVRVSDGLDGLAAHLLGRTLVVQDLSAALAVPRDDGFRFVTATGDILESDGTITAGDPHAPAGLISRRSQLRALLGEIVAIGSQIAELEERLQSLDAELSQLRENAAQLQSRLTATTDEVAQIRSVLGQRRQQIAGLEEELRVDRGEIDALDHELGTLAARRTTLQGELAEAELQLGELDSRIHEMEAAGQHHLAEAEARQQVLIDAKVELAKTEGQLAGLRQRVAALTTDLEDRRRVQRETREQIAQSVEREGSCQRKVLTGSSRIAELYLQKEKLRREIVALLNRREGLREQRQTLSAESQAVRENLQTTQAELHQCDLQANDIRHQRTTLVDRIREDYNLDLAEVSANSTPHEALDREATGQQIQELRRKIAGLGNVNLEALQELQELETRSTTLHAQLDDLNQSKATLNEILQKINQDSQRMFLETFETIRGHFGELFRKLFGGGRAEILLENESDVLESGIEIVARPPGKELRSLSLLSGGEKTLTAVALLLAVFRSRPSPFCILDEVDAALDEANIERFTTLLHEFSSESQFIMITHSKKSMTCADVLYGITMQESGVSKRVSVRFEDVNEQGEISQAALERAAVGPPAPEPVPPVVEPEQEAA